MKNEDKTKEKLIRELTDLRRKLIELESSDTRQREMLRDLGKSGERYRLLVESSSDFIWEVDANGIYTYANLKVKDLLGYEPEEIIGKTPFDLMPAYEAKRVARLFKDIFESQKPFRELENTNLHKDGHHVVFDTSGVPIFDTNGNLSGYRGRDRDISERKRAEEVMKKTKDFSDNIIESSLDCIVISDRRGYLTRVNKYFLELLGYKEEEVLGKHIAEFAPPEEGDYELITGGLIKIDKDFFENQLSMMCLLVEEGKVSNWDAYYCRKDGKILPIEQNIVYLYDEQGEKAGSVGISRDVTERRKAERDLQETKMFLDNVIDSSLDYIVVTDRSGYLTRVNKSFLKLLGYEEEEVLGKHIAEFAPSEEGDYELIAGEMIELNKDFFENQLSMVPLLIENGRVSNWDAYYCRKDGKLIPVEQNIAYLYDEHGEKTGAVGITRDVTERRKAEKNLQETKMFLDNVIESSLDCIVVSDRSGYLTRVNKSFLKLLGYEEREVLGRHIAEFAPPEGGGYESTTGEVVEINEAYYKKQLDMMVAIIEKGGVSNWEAYYCRKDKKLVPAGQSSSYLYNKRGEKIGSVGIVRDITERRKAERDLKETKEFLDNIIESSQDCIIVSDTKGNLMRVNEYFLQLLGYKEEEVLGKHITEFTPLKEGVYESSTGTLVEINKEFFDRAYSMVTTLIEAGKITNRETYFLTKDNKVIPTEENIVYLYNNAGKKIGAVGILRDITVRKQAEEKLKETTSFLDNILESLQDCVVVTDVNGYYKRVNKYFLELLGYEEEEVLGKHISEFTPLAEGSYELITGESVKINGEFFDHVKSMISEFIDKGKISNWESYFVRKDNKLVFVEERMVYLYNNTGEKIGAVGIVRDITERKQAEEQLKRTSAFLDNIIESSLDLIMVTDRGGYITRVNRFFLELLGYKEEEVLGKHTSEFAPKRDTSYDSATGEVIKIDREHYDAVIAAMSRLVEEGKLSNWEFYVVRKDKKVIPVEENIVYLYDDSGDTIGAVGILRNITERKKAEKEITEARDFLENIFRTSVDGIITTDYKGNITMVNRAVEEILGYSKDELVGKHATELGPKGGYYKERTTEFYATIMEKGIISEFEYIWLKKDGKEVDIEFNAAMLRDSKGKFAGIMSSLRDITERKKTEERLKEYQNQLRSLTSQLTLTEERARRRIATDLHDRIGQALAMSKIKLGSLRESASSIGLDGDVDKIRDLIEQTIQDTRSLIFDICPPLLYELGFEKAVEWLLENIQEEHGINALFEDDGIPKLLEDDMRVLLYQTVRELLMNVVKHAQAKKVMVSFKGNRGHVKISVEDDGIGFDPSKISSRMGKPEGFGLFRIVERLHYLGGEIQFESKPHHGTKIFMVVPTEQSGQTRKEELK